MSGGVVFATSPRWSNQTAVSLRDIAFRVSRDAGRTFAEPVRISEDGWQLNGCPDDGPAMAVDRSGTLHVVWPTVLPGREPEGALFYASTRDGRTFTPRLRVRSDASTVGRGDEAPAPGVIASVRQR